MPVAPGRSRTLPGVVVGALLGLTAAALAAVLGSAEPGVLVVGMAGVACLTVFVWLRSPRLTSTLLVGGIAFSIPVNLDFNLFYRHHVGGAPSITVNLTLLGLMLFYPVWAYRYRIGAQGHFLRAHRPILWAAVTLLAITPLSLINANHPELVLLEWVRLVFLVLAMIAVMSLQDDRLIRLWIFVLSLQVVIQAGLAGAQYLLKHPLGLGIFGEDVLVAQDIGYVFNRTTGTIGHPNVLSYFFEILLPVMLALALTRQQGHRQLWYAFAFAAGIGGIFTTLSRGAWLTLPVSLAIVIIVVYGHRIVRPRSAFAAFLIGCVLLSTIYVAYPTIHKRFTHSDFKSAQSRMPLNRAAWSIIEQFPIVGVGLNNFAEAFKIHDQTGFSRIFRGYDQVVHNLHLWIWTETGTLGMLAFLAPFLVVMVVAARTAARAPPVAKATLVGIIAGLTAHLMHGMVDPGFRISLTVSLLIFTLFGIVGALALRYAPNHRP